LPSAAARSIRRARLSRRGCAAVPVTSGYRSGKSHTTNEIRARRHEPHGHEGVAHTLRIRYEEKRPRFEASQTVARVRRRAPTTQLAAGRSVTPTRHARAHAVSSGHDAERVQRMRNVCATP